MSIVMSPAGSAEPRPSALPESRPAAARLPLLVMISPKVSVSQFMGMVKGRTAIRVFQKFAYLKQKPYWGNHFWAPGYCVDTIGLDAEMIRAYVKY